MTISATVVADSICAVTGERLTSLLLEYPRFIHGEFMTLIENYPSEVQDD